jgi:hypothetical protein
MGAMLIIGMGPRKAGEGKTSPAPSNKEKSAMKEGMVKLPVSMFELPEGEENAMPEAGDSVELEGTVDSIKDGVAYVRINEAMSEESKNESGEESEMESEKPEMSEEDRMMEMARKSDEENYS